jgi:hypothetical protein
MTDHGKVRYQLKSPYRDGTTHVFFDPLDFDWQTSRSHPTVTLAHIGVVL